jgi:hypothetical protein
MESVARVAVEQRVNIILNQSYDEAASSNSINVVAEG